MALYQSCSQLGARLTFRNLSLGEYLEYPFLSLHRLIIHSHLSGYRDSGPVRIGNGAAFHQQFDIYGELMDAIYLWNKYGKPVTWDQWVAVREILGILFHVSLSQVHCTKNF